MQERVAGHDFRPLGLPIRGLSLKPILADTQVAEPIGLSGHAVVLLQRVVSLAGPSLIGGFDDLPQQGFAGRVADLRELKAEEHARTRVGWVAIEDLAEQGQSGGNPLQIGSFSGRFPECRRRRCGRSCQAAGVRLCALRLASFAARRRRSCQPARLAFCQSTSRSSLIAPGLGP